MTTRLVLIQPDGTSRRIKSRSIREMRERGFAGFLFLLHPEGAPRWMATLGMPVLTEDEALAVAERLPARE